jgi:hypothetical protein
MSEMSSRISVEGIHGSMFQGTSGPRWTQYVIEGRAVKLVAASQSGIAIPRGHCPAGQVLDGEYLSAEPIFSVSPNA